MTEAEARCLVVRTVPTAGPLRDQMDAAGNPPVRWNLIAIGPNRCTCCRSLLRRWSAVVDGVVLTISERDQPDGTWRGVWYDISDGERTEECTDFEMADLRAIGWRRSS